MKTEASPVPADPASPCHEEDHSVSGSPTLPQRGNALRAQLHLVVGPVGAGKSTFAMELGRGRRKVRLTLDEWMATLFRPDRPETNLVEWYVERAGRCIEQIWALTTQLLGSGTDVILEIGLLRRVEREAFYQRVDAADVDLTVHVIDAARDIRRARVMHRNDAAGPTFSMVVPPSVFEYASDLWEPPGPTECDGRSVGFIRTDGTCGGDVTAEDGPLMPRGRSRW